LKCFCKGKFSDLQNGLKVFTLNLREKTGDFCFLKVAEEIFF